MKKKSINTPLSLTDATVLALMLNEKPKTVPHNEHEWTRHWHLEALALIDLSNDWFDDFNYVGSRHHY